MQETQKTPPVDAGGDDENLWKQFDEAEAEGEQAPPDEGRDEPKVTAETDDPEPAPTEPTADAQAAPEAAAQAQTPDDEVWANVPPQVRAAYEEAQKKARDLEHRIKSDAGRVARYQREVEDLRRRAAAPEQPPADPRQALAKLKDTLKDYPELGAPIVEAMNALDSRLQQFETIEQRRMQAALSREEQRVSEIHADWRDVLRTHGNEFMGWVQGPDIPRGVYEMAMRNGNAIVNADEAARVIDAFKQHIGVGAQQQAQATSPAPDRNPLADRRQRQLDASRAPRSSAGGRATLSGVPEDGDPEAIWRAFDAMEASQGR